MRVRGGGEGELGEVGLGKDTRCGIVGVGVGVKAKARLDGLGMTAGTTLGGT